MLKIVSSVYTDVINRNNLTLALNVLFTKYLNRLRLVLFCSIFMSFETFLSCIMSFLNLNGTFFNLRHQMTHHSNSHVIFLPQAFCHLTKIQN